MAGTSGSFGGVGAAAEGADAVAADAEVLFAGGGAFAADALAEEVFAGVLAVLADGFSDFAFGDGVAVFTLASAGDALAPLFEALAMAGSVLGCASSAGFDGC